MSHSKWQAFVLSTSLLLMCTTMRCAQAAQEIPDAAYEEIKTRIAPVASVCLSGQPCAKATAPAAPKGPRTAEAIFGKYCTTCHKTGLLNAPKKDDAAAWQQRVDARPNGFADLLQHALNGFNNMPAKGTCANCSEDEISSAIQYMSGLSP